MSSKTTWSLVTVSVILFALIFFIEHPLREQARTRQTNRKIFPEFNPSAVTEITVLADQLICAQRTTNAWLLSKPINYPAASERVDKLLQALANLEWQARITSQELKDRPQAQEEFGFAPPRFSIVAQEGRLNHRLLIGTNSAMGDQVYIQVVGSETICRVSSELLKFIPANKDQWRDTELVNLEEIPFESVKVQSHGKSFELQRDLQGLWFLKSLQARADSVKVENLMKQLQDLRVVSFVNDGALADLEPYGLQASPQTPELEISFLQKTNTVFSFQVGASPTNHADQIYARRLSPSNIVLVPKEPLRAWQAANTNFVDRHLISVSPSQIETIEVQAQGDEPFTLRRQMDGTWIASAGSTFTCDTGLMNGLIHVFTNAEVEIEKTVVADVASYGFVPPSLQYTLKGGPNAFKTNLIAQIQFGTNLANKVFERRTDEPSLNSIQNELFDRLPRAAWQLRDRSIWSFASTNVISATVRQKGSIRKFIRDPDWAWTFAPGSHGNINPFSLEETLHRLGELKAIYWSGVGEKDLDRFGFRETEHQITLEVQNGSQKETLNIQFGKPSPYSHPYATVVIKGQRLIFEFPVDLYLGGVRADLTIPPALRGSHKE